MPRSEGNSVQCSMAKRGLSAALVALLAGVLVFASAGCMLPLLSAIPSVISLAHAAYKASSGTDNDDAKDQEAEASTLDSNKPPAKLTPANLCQMMAIERPDMVLIELRKNGAGAPEYRELHLLNSAEEAHWTPVLGSGIPARTAGVRQ
jgi:hypothetical protein